METNISSYPKRWAALAILCISLLIIAIDSTVLNMSIPSISSSLGVSTAQLMWIVDAYSIVFASLMLTTGTLGDRFGRRLILAIGLIIFGLGSLGAAHAGSGDMLIAFRVIQGIGGSMMMPCTLSIIVYIFRDHTERSRALAIWSGTFGIGAGIGPLVGGLLLNYFNWPSVFYLNIPIVIIGLVGGYLLIPESKDPAKPKLDIGGFLLSFAGILAAVYAIIKAGEIGWNRVEVIVPFLSGILLMVAFIRWEMHTPAPMLPIYFFKNRSFTGGAITMFLNAFSLFGTGYFFSQYFQSVLGYTPLAAAMAMAPQIIIQYFATLNSVNIVKRIGTKWTIAFGLFISGIGIGLFSLLSQMDTAYPILIIPMLIMGIGMGNIMTPAMTSTVSALPPNRSGIGSAVADTFMNVGGALGFAVNGAIMNRFYRLEIAQNITPLALPDELFEMIRSSVQNALVAAQQLSGELVSQVIITAKAAFLTGMDSALYFIGGFMIFAGLMVIWLVPANIQYTMHES